MPSSDNPTLQQRLRKAHLDDLLASDAPPRWTEVAVAANLAEDDPVAAARQLEGFLSNHPRHTKALITLLKVRAQMGSRDEVSKVLDRIEASGIQTDYWFKRFQDAWNGQAISMGDVDLHLDSEAIDANILIAIAQGSYEQKEARFTCDIVRDGDRVLDLGAGVGYIASSVLKRRRVAWWRSYEANPALLPVIERNRALNNIDFEIVWGAASSQDGDCTLRNMEAGFWGASILEGFEKDAGITVPMIDVTRVIEEENVNVLIADVEGAEYDILAHAPLQTLDRLVIEFHPKLVDAKTHTRAFQKLISAGFVMDTERLSGDVVTWVRASDAS